jgi:anthranilate synthase
MSDLPSDSPTRIETPCGIVIRRRATAIDAAEARAALVAALDTRRGVLLSSGTDVPGRYTRYDLGFADPPLVLEGRGRRFSLRALNARGALILPPLAAALAAEPGLRVGIAGDMVSGEVCPAPPVADETLRTRQPSLMTVVRALMAALATDCDSVLGLYGAFGYDLVFSFESLVEKRPRAADQRDLVLFLPDRVVRADHAAGRAERLDYEFSLGDARTDALDRATPDAPYVPTGGTPFADHAPGDYQETVRLAQRAFAAGDLFEAVPGQLRGIACAKSPSAVFTALARANPAPYGALINLGEGEFLVSASPEMFVRAQGRRIETCPISGTIARGRDPIEDARNILTLLNSKKDEHELNMCTDVDRNDKARVCVPGSVKVIGRRQIEMYSRLIHTVDHVEGELREGMDALDAFLSHAWAVTVTGAPKKWAMQFVEDHERSPRRWYGGAIGGVMLDGGLNTGLTLRTIRMKDGIAEIRAGATLLHDSDPDAEAAECTLKASALVAVVEAPDTPPRPTAAPIATTGPARRMLLVDCEDSFVHMLADYLRQGGARVDVVRHGEARAALTRGGHDLIGLSPGPGEPADFGLHALIDDVLARKLPIFGVCLGMQAIGQYFGGRLDTLGEPVHGRATQVSVTPGGLFAGCAERITVGRYHSLYLAPETIAAPLRVTAVSDDGIPMAIAHERLPIAAVQFHPESILSAGGGEGLTIVRNALRLGLEPNQ